MNQAHSTGTFMNYQLSDEQEMIIDSLAAFLEKEIYPHEAE